MNEATAVDVVVVAHRSEHVLEETIGCVRGWSRCGRVIVVDHGGGVASQAAVRAHADIVVEAAENAGFGAGQNAGVARVRTESFLMLNPDARVEPRGLDAGAAVLAASPEVALVQGVILRSGDGGPERSAGPEPGITSLVAHRFGIHERLGEERIRSVAARSGFRWYVERIPEGAADVDFVAAVAPLVRTAAFRSVGGFDERYFLYAEDVDLGRRLRRAGWTLRTLPVAWAAHVGGASSADPELRDRQWWQSHRLLVATHWRGWRRRVGLALCHGR